MTEELDDRQYLTICVTGGNSWLWEHNSQKVKCQLCRRIMERGGGFGFHKAYMERRYSSGYICPACIGSELEKVAEWHWNSFTKTLFPALHVTTRKFPGPALADGWKDGRLIGLWRVLNNVSNLIYYDIYDIN